MAKIICPDCGFEVINGVQEHSLDTCIDNLRNQVAELTAANEKLKRQENRCIACQRAEKAEKTVKALAENATQDTLLFEEILGGALQQSCVYRNNELVDHTFHCCDWSDISERISKRLGINLEEHQPGEGKA